MSFQDAYEKYYQAQNRGQIPPNTTSKDRPIAATISKYLNGVASISAKQPGKRKALGTEAVKRKRRKPKSHSTSSRRGVKTDEKQPWKLIRKRYE